MINPLDNHRKLTRHRHVRKEKRAPEGGLSRIGPLQDHNIPSMPPPDVNSGRSAITASVVISRNATYAASSSAIRATFAGSMDAEREQVAIFFGLCICLFYAWFCRCTTKDFVRWRPKFIYQ